MKRPLKISLVCALLGLAGGSRAGGEPTTEAGPVAREPRELRAKFTMTFKLFGGEVELAGENMDFSAKNLELTLSCRDVELGALLAFIDAERKWVVEAAGRVSGQARLRFERGTLVGVGPGRFELAKGSTPARLLLTPMPGLFSSYLPAAIRKQLPGFDALELGKTALLADVLRLELMARPDERGRVATLRIEGKPEDPRLTAPLATDINFRGDVVETVWKTLLLRLKIGGG